MYNRDVVMQEPYGGGQLACPEEARVLRKWPNWGSGNSYKGPTMSLVEVKLGTRWHGGGCPLGALCPTAVEATRLEEMV
jgi:hypothetical protein